MLLGLAADETGPTCKPGNRTEDITSSEAESGPSKPLSALGCKETSTPWPKGSITKAKEGGHPQATGVAGDVQEEQGAQARATFQSWHWYWVL